MFPLMPIFWIVALAAMVAGAARDLKDRIIPDRLVLVVLAAGAALRIAGRDAGLAFAAAALVYLVVLVLARAGLIGGGDAKLIAASALLVPPSETGTLIVEIALAGGVLGCAYLLARTLIRRSLLPAVASLQTPSSAGTGLVRGEIARIGAGEPMPYAFAILGGVAFHFLHKVLACSSATLCLS